MTRIFDIANTYVDQLANLDPNFATSIGVPGHETELTDFSPEGVAKTADLSRTTRAAVEAASPENEHDRVARDVMLERMAVRLDLYDAGEYLRDVKIIGSGMGAIRSVFDQMPRTTEQDWQHIAGRLANVPPGPRPLPRLAQEGHGRRQVRRPPPGGRVREAGRDLVRPQAGHAVVLQHPHRPPSTRATSCPTPSAPMSARGIAGAEAAYASLRDFLRDDYAPKADERDGSGRERYALNSRVFNGTELDLEETYRWGWDELYRTESEMTATADKIKSGATPAEAQAVLEADPARALESPEAWQAWLQEVHDRALDDLDGTHFDIDPRIKRVEVMIPPPGGALAPYYTGPSEDFARPGRTWWPRGARTRFPKWFGVTTAYHEGVPGHHLQIGTVRCVDRPPLPLPAHRRLRLRLQRRAGRSTPSASWASSAISRTPTTTSACSPRRRCAPCA